MLLYFCNFFIIYILGFFFYECNDSCLLDIQSRSVIRCRSTGHIKSLGM